MRNLILLLFFLTFVSPSFAASYAKWQALGGYIGSAESAMDFSCNYVYTGALGPASARNITKPSDTRYQFQCKRNSDGRTYDDSFAIEPIANSKCPDGQDAADGVCVPPPEVCSTGVQKWYSWSSSAAKQSVCSASCLSVSSGMQVSSSSGSSGQFTSNGLSCSGDNAAPDPGTCPKGTHNISSNPSQVNCTADAPELPKCWVGSTNVSTDPTVALCVGNDVPKTGPDDPASHTPDPNIPPVVNTTNVVEKTSDGGVKNTSTTTTTISNTDGSTSVKSVTTITKTAPDGTQTTTTDSNKPKDETKDFCQLNPTLTICKNSSVSGDCDTLSIDGDAIQGAILRQQKKEYCENMASSNIKDLGLLLLAGNDPSSSQFPTIDNATVVDLSNIGNLDSSGFLSGGSCFTDKSFAVAGVTVKLPISILCDYLTPLRLAVMLLALMASYKMIAGTVLRDL